MASQKAVAVSGFLSEFFQAGLYKPNQGKLARQWTCYAIWLVFAVCAWKLRTLMGVSYNDNVPQANLIFPGVLLAFGLWVGFRIVNTPRFAEFLIAVEAEMNKVSWPSRAELSRSSVVVIFVIFAMAMVLWAYDYIWAFIFVSLGIIR